MKKIYYVFIVAVLALCAACEIELLPTVDPDENIEVEASFKASVGTQADGTYRLFYNQDGFLNEINSGTVVNFESTATGNPADEDMKWAISWIDADSNKAVTKEIYATLGAAFMRFVEPGAYNVTMTAEDSEVTYLSYINVLEPIVEEPDPDVDPDVDPDGDKPATLTDTFLAAAGWDTGFEDTSMGFWKNFGWGNAFNMNTISASTAKAKNGSGSTYFNLQSKGGMAGGFRDASGAQLTIPVVEGTTYSVGFWIYIEEMPENANLSVVFGGNKSGYIPVTDLLTTELNTWAYKVTNVEATGSNIADLLLFSDLSNGIAGEGEFNFYIDDIAMCEYDESAVTPDGGSTGGDGGDDTTTTQGEDTYLAAAGWDTSFEDSTLGYWKNFGWGNAFNMNTISNSTVQAKTGSHSTYFELESKGGMAGGFRGPGEVQLTIPVVEGQSYEVSFWMYVEEMPENANLSVVFGGNKSGYIPVTDLLTTELNKWVYKTMTIEATGSDISDLLLFSDLSNGIAGEGEFNFYIDDIAMCDAK